MAELTEKREFERYNDQAEIVYAVSGSTRYSNAKMHNCSMGGMYFNSKYPLEPGTEVSVKMISFRSMFDAEVVRCMEIIDMVEPCYGVGIQYDEPVQ